MIGAIIGDLVGSRFEFIDDEKRDRNFAMFSTVCKITDDSLMTLAVARALFLAKGDKQKLKKIVVSCMKDVAREHPNTSWGERFYKWLFLEDFPKPYNSYGNGAAMRICPVGWVANSEAEVKELTKIITEVSHNHPEGIKGAEAIAMGVYLARIGKSKEEIRLKLQNYYPQLALKDFSIANIYGNYGYDSEGNWVTCQGSVPQAIVAFLDSSSFEDAIRNAISIGGDSDTIGAMTGSIAEAYYGVTYEMEEKALEFLPQDLQSIYFAFELIKKKRAKAQ